MSTRSSHRIPSLECAGSGVVGVMSMILKERPGVYELSRGFSQRTDLASEGFAPGTQDEWWSPALDRKTVKALMKRQDTRPLLDYGRWLCLLIGSGGVAFFAWGSWWAVPAFLAYGTIYSSCDP